MSIEEYLFPLNVMIVTAAFQSIAPTLLRRGERGVVQARSEQDFLTQTKFQSDEDSFLASLFSVFVAMTFLGPVDF